MAIDFYPATRTIIRWSGMRQEWVLLTLLDVYDQPGSDRRVVRQFEAVRRTKYRPTEPSWRFWERMRRSQAWNEHDVRKEFIRWST